MSTATSAAKSAASSNSEKRAAQIYRVAAELIQEKGYAATSMNDIAKKLKLTKAGLYYYIKGKDDLLYSIIKFGMQKLKEQVIEPCRLIEDPEKRLKEIAERHTTILMDLGGAITILTDETQRLSTPNRRRIEALKRQYIDFVRDTLKELRAQKKMRTMNINLTSMNFFAVILGVARWYNPKKEWSSKRTAREISKFVMGAIVKDGQ